MGPRQSHRLMISRIMISTWNQKSCYQEKVINGKPKEF